MPINSSASVAGGSGPGATIYLFKDSSCKEGASNPSQHGVDSNNFPCYNVQIAAFSVGTSTPSSHQVDDSRVVLPEF